jgi:Undecaprenyl-phosphate glucose phosphotransferase
LGRDGALVCDDLLDLNRDGKLNEIVICASAMDSKQLTNLMHRLRRIPVSIKFIPDSELHFFLQRPLVDIGAGVAVELQRRPCSTFDQTIKRLIDIAFAAAGLLALWPMMLMVAALIRLDSPGPIFFAQRRTGFNGRVFRILKFRSMTTADDGNVIRQASRGDARVTRIGGWLRSTSIDELPQLINVLRGEMSIVGPRPHAVAHDAIYSKLLDNYALRFRVPPGITGWAQVTGYRGETTTTDLMAKRVERDLWYIENWSLALDIKIIFRTIYSVMKIRDVY